MKQIIICKGLAVAVILLFLGLAIQPSVAVQPEADIDIKPKDYLFQTIIDIANNPEVKDLLEQYDNDLFKVDIDRSVYRKLFLRNPRLFRSLIFTKPSLTYENLNNYYNKGIELTKLIGENEVLDIVESIEITDRYFLNKFNNIISNDEELSNLFEALKEKNNEIKPNAKLDFDTFPIICTILAIILVVYGFVLLLFSIPEYILTIPLYFFKEYRLFPILAIIGYIVESIFVYMTVLFIAIGLFGCLLCLEELPI